MAMSMTGFGRGTAEDARYHVTVEAKSVNHRFLEIIVRAPRTYGYLEDRVRQAFQSAFSRGKIEVRLQIRLQPQEIQLIKANFPLLEGYLRCCNELKDRFGIEGEIKLEHLLQLEDIFQPDEDENEEERVAVLTDAAVKSAIDELNKMRRAEGANLASDLKTRLSRLDDEMDAIEGIAENLPGIYREKLQRRIAEICNGQTLDENRLAMEVVLYADRSSIDEEIVRFRSHIQQFRQALAKNESVGRRLDFLTQELNREINTIGSKAGDLAISQSVVEIKTELEKIREQIQNIE